MAGSGLLHCAGGVRDTTDLAAYDLYLRGQFAFRRHHQSDPGKANLQTRLAIEQFANIERVATYLSFDFLKLQPQWDSLRGEPEFDKSLSYRKSRRNKRAAPTEV